MSNLASIDRWLEHRKTALLVPPNPKPVVLATAILEALNNPVLRAEAAAANRRRIEASAVYEDNMLLMERHYYRLAGQPTAEWSS